MEGAVSGAYQSLAVADQKLTIRAGLAVGPGAPMLLVTAGVGQ